MLEDHLQESKERIQKFKEAGDSQFTFQNKLDKACFQHDGAYEDLKELTRGIASCKYSVIKYFNLMKIQIMIDIKGFINFLIKRPLVEQLKLKCILKKLAKRITQTNY